MKRLDADGRSAAWLVHHGRATGSTLSRPSVEQPHNYAYGNSNPRLRPIILDERRSSNRKAVTS